MYEQMMLHFILLKPYFFLAKTNTNTAGQLSNKEKSVHQATRIASTRDRRPSDKVAAQRMFSFFLALQFGWNYLYFTVEAQQVAAKLKANKEECRTHHKKRALQKANRQAGIESSSEDVFERRTNPTVRLLFSFQIQP